MTPAPPAPARSEESASAEPDPAESGPAKSGPVEPAIEPDTDLEELDPEAAQAKAEAEAKAAAEKQRICALLQADQRYQAGDLAAAEQLYRAAKAPFARSLGAGELSPAKAAIADPEALSPGGRVFLREAAAGQAQNLETRTLVPLELLVQQHPEFIPGHIQFSEALVAAGRSEEGLAVLAAATRDYPNQPDLLRAQIALAAEQKQWMDAAMVARRFAQLNPDHPEAAAFVALAEENMALYQRDLRDRLRTNTLANVLTGAISVALTGNIWNSLPAVQTTAMMLRGEAGVGQGLSKSIQRQIEMVEDEEIVTYINELGQRLAQVAGRDEFEYEFHVVMDDTLNAFALPGGKVFVNAGAIAKTQSEAELAGLLSHELAHAVLSHGFRLVSDGSLLSDLSRFIPYGGYASNLVVLNYSRTMEREADELGARILASAGYAADGLHGLMQTLGEGNSRRPLFAWMSTHPETDERIGNLEAQISREGLNRYQFEGVERHHRMRVKTQRLINDWKERQAKEKAERPWWRR
ncbi:MAG: M48 family metalloprotease [Synechococcales cyanobacterium RM1_1_8]|nr:M48 family metalloprotease [Synechococcales cyanobacterium RM1_1_8]